MTPIERERAAIRGFLESIREVLQTLERASLIMRDVLAKAQAERNEIPPDEPYDERDTMP
mgnify:CR=1 FL=1